MYPVLFKIPGINYEVPGYGVALMVGFLLSIMWAAQRALKSRANPDIVLNCGFIAIIGGVVGARFMYVMHYWEQFAHHGSPVGILFAIVDVRKGGLEVYGGFIAVALAVWIYLWRWGHSVRWYLDIMAPSAALGMGIGRIGCYLNGCCWGGVCHDLPWAVQFPFGSPAEMRQWEDRLPEAGLPKELILSLDEQRSVPIPREALRVSDAELDAARQRFDVLRQEMAALQAQRAASTDTAEITKLNTAIAAKQRDLEPGADFTGHVGNLMSKYNLSAEKLRALAHVHPSLPVHPTQLYDTAGLIFLALLLDALYWRRTRDGQVIALFFVLQPPTRWLIEVLRADNPVDTAGFTISQFLALCLTLLGVVTLIALHYMPARSPKAVPWEPPPEDKHQSPKPASA